VCCSDGTRRSDKGAQDRTAEGECERSVQLEVVLEIFGGHGRAEEQDAAPLECERARDDTSSQFVRVALRASDNNRWTTRLLGDHAESDDELIDGCARGMFIGDAEVSRRPTQTELGLNRTKHVDRDVIERHALSQKLGCEPISECDIAINEGRQHRKTLIAKSLSAELRTQLVCLLAHSSSNLLAAEPRSRVASRFALRRAYGAVMALDDTSAR
jgi:hypothetical protein